MIKRPLIALLVILVLFVGAMQFIKINNDHQECEQLLERRKDASGNIVTTEKHVCNEAFSF